MGSHCVGGDYRSSGGYQEFGSIIDFFSKYLLNNLPWVRHPSKGFNSFIQLIFFKILVCARHGEGCFVYVLMGSADIRCFSWPVTLQTFIKHFLVATHQGSHDRLATCPGTLG